MSAPVALFDNGKTRMTLRARKPQAARLVVVFNPMHSNDVEQPGWGEDFLWGAGFDILSVKGRTNQWYQDVSLSDFAKVMAKLKYETVFSYSVSMGAYAATYFAGAIKAKRAILFSPQYSIDPVVTYWDRRWKDYWLIPFQHEPLTEVAYPHTEYVIAYDPWWDLDGRHADEIAAAVGPQNVRPIKAFLSGHESITMLHDTGVLAKLVLALLEDSAEVPVLLSTFSRRRKETWLHAYALFMRAHFQRRRVANTAFALEVGRRAERTPHRVLSLMPLVVIGAWDEAVQAIADLPAIKLGENREVDGAVASVSETIGIHCPGAGAAVEAAWARKLEQSAATDAAPGVALQGASTSKPRQMRRPMTLARLFQR